MHIRTLAPLLVIISIFFLGSSPVFGLEVGLRSGQRTADMSYRLDSNGDISRLTFPVDNNSITVSLSESYEFTFLPEMINNYEFNLSYTDLVEGRSGVGRDFDRLSNETDEVLTGSTHSGLDIFSESEASLTEGRIYDGKATLNLEDFTGYNLGLIGGYRYSDYHIKTRNLDQKGFGPYDFLFTTTREGLIITYRRETYFPYMGIQYTFETLPGIELNLSGVHSQEVRVEDVDDHHLRKKLSKGNLSGDGERYSANLRLPLPYGVSLELNADHFDYEVYGHQDQRWYGDDPATIGIDDTGDMIKNIPDTVQGEETSYGLGLTYHW